MLDKSSSGRKMGRQKDFIFFDFKFFFLVLIFTFLEILKWSSLNENILSVDNTSSTPWCPQTIIDVLFFSSTKTSAFRDVYTVFALMQFFCWIMHHIVGFSFKQMFALCASRLVSYLFVLLADRRNVNLLFS